VITRDRIVPVPSPFRLLAAVLLLAAGPLLVSPARAVIVGCYEMCRAEGTSWQATPVKAAGQTAVLLGDLTPAALGRLDVLFVTNCSNDSYHQSYLSHLADIEAAVARGMVLVVHDRQVTDAATILPGGNGITLTRDEGPLTRNIDVLDDTTLITDGPGGSIDDATLDEGTQSNHGYAEEPTLPPGATPILSSAESQIVTFGYPFRQGFVVYSTIPLDYYLDPGIGAAPDFQPPDAFRLAYAPNVVAFAAAASLCGNGNLDAGEQCDDGNRLSGDCCSPTCRIEDAGTVCRAAAGACDVVETCTGDSPTCPTDGFAFGTVCRPAAGACDTAETCSGNGPQCPPDQVLPAATVCRASAGDCDVAETCTGTDAACPADQFLPSTTTCRPSVDVCDVAESCTGTSAACPGDGIAPAGTVCRQAASACDLSESCDGTNVSCPADVVKQEGDACDDGDPGTATSTCQQQACLGVAVGIAIPPVIDVPAQKPPGKVKIPADIEIPDTAGTAAARVTVQGFVDCLDLPVADRPVQCGSVAIASRSIVTKVESTFLPVTRPRTKSLGRTQARTVRVNLPLTKLGRKLFGRLRGGEEQRQLPVQITAALSDRQGRTITAVFQSLLNRRR
jgi:cysteine-rich repeat protein